MACRVGMAFVPAARRASRATSTLVGVAFGVVLWSVCTPSIPAADTGAPSGKKAAPSIPEVRLEREQPLNTDPDELERVRSKGKRLAEEAFERGYTTTPVHVTLEGHAYRIPMNYLTAFGNQPREMTPKYVNVFMFLPDFSGYAKDNYLDPFDKRKITVFWGRSFGGAPPENRLANLFKYLGVERDPYEHRYGLAVHAGKRDHVDWLVGRRRNGDLIVFECYRNAPEKGIVNPLCITQYPNRENGYDLNYRFSLDQLAKWQEIDARINATIMGWRTK